MATKISAHPSASSASASDETLVNVSGTTSRMTLLNIIKSMVAPSAANNVLTSDGTNWTSQAPMNITTDASSATPTPTGGYAKNFYTITALAVAAEFAAPSGTPANGNVLLVRIKDNGTARALTYNAIYRAVGVTLKTTTTISKTQYFIAIYNSADSKWDVISVREQA